MLRPTPLIGIVKMFTTLQFRLLLGVLALCLSSCGQSVPSPRLTPLVSGQTLRVVSQAQDLMGSSEPQWATDCQGNFVVVWAGHSRQLQQKNAIYAQRYNQIGSPQGERILVAEGIYDPDINADISTLSEPAVSMNCQGDFVVAWKQIQNFDIAGMHPTRYDVYFQRYNQQGQTAGHKIRAIEPTGKEKFIFLDDIVLSNQKDVLLTWVGVHGQIIYGRYHHHFSLQPQEFIIPETISSPEGVAVTNNPQGEFLVTWLSSRSEVQLQHYIKGQPQHTQALRFSLPELPTEPHSFPGNSRFSRIQVLPTQSGDFVVIWSEGKYAYAKRYQRHGNMQETGEIIIGQHFAINSKDQLISVWEENGDPTNTLQINPGEFLTVTENAFKRIYLQTYNTRFEALNAEPILFKELPYFSDGTCYSCLLVASTPDNGAKVLWLQRPGSHSDTEGIYVQTHTFDGQR